MLELTPRKEIASIIFNLLSGSIIYYLTFKNIEYSEEELIMLISAGIVVLIICLIIGINAVKNTKKLVWLRKTNLFLSTTILFILKIYLWLVMQLFILFFEFFDYSANRHLKYYRKKYFK